MIQIKTEDEIALMRAAGLLVRPAARAAARGRRPRGHDRRPRRDLGGLHPREGGVPSFLGYHGFPARSARRSTTRSCTASRPAAVLRDGDSSRWTAARSSTASTATRPSRSPSATVRRELTELIRVCEESMWARVRRRSTLGGRLSDISARGRGLHPRQPHLRHRRGVRRPRHRHRDAPGPARAQLRAARARARSWSRAWRWPSSRWSPRQPATRLLATTGPS